jgi:Uma2 family endonuclease
MTLKDHFITTAEEFDVFVLRDENIDRSFEYIGGEIVEKMVSNDIAGMIAARIIRFIGVYLDGNDIGEMFSDNTGFKVNGERYIPDASFLSYEKHPDVLGVAYRPDPPDLAIEVVSSERNSERTALMVKVKNYNLAGAIVWVVDPKQRHIEVYEEGQKPIIVRDGSTLDGGEILPNFRLDISKLFKRLPE